MLGRRSVVSGVTLAATALLLAGCGTTATTSQSESSSMPAASTEPSSAAEPSANEPASPAPPAGTVVDITLANGTVTPTNGRVDAAVGEPIVLNVSSDAADQLHVHSVPEHTFQVEPRPDQRFEFAVDVPGQVAIELHDLNRTVVTIQVRP